MIHFIILSKTIVISVTQQVSGSLLLLIIQTILYWTKITMQSALLVMPTIISKHILVMVVMNIQKVKSERSTLKKESITFQIVHPVTKVVMSMILG